MTNRAGAKAGATLAPLASKGTLELCLPECEKGLGSLINSPSSADLTIVKEPEVAK